MTTSDSTTGHVDPGGPSWVLDLGPAEVRKCSVSEMDNNVYLVTCRGTGQRLLVDAADDMARIDQLLVENDGAAPETIVTTHQHWDHHRALPETVRRTGATTVAGAEDADGLPVPVDRPVGHGDTVPVGDLVLDVVALRGHTPGSIALALSVPGHPTVLLTGDSLFPGGVGKTSSPEDFGQLLTDVQDRVFGEYDDDALVLPGHGDNTVLGRERPQLEEWRARGW